MSRNGSRQEFDSRHLQDIIYNLPALDHLTQTEVAVFQALAFHADWDTLEANPAVSRLAQETRLNRNTVRVILRRLEEWDYLRTSERPGFEHVFILNADLFRGIPRRTAPRKRGRPRTKPRAENARFSDEPRAENAGLPRAENAGLKQGTPRSGDETPRSGDETPRREREEPSSQVLEQVRTPDEAKPPQENATTPKVGDADLEQLSDEDLEAQDRFLKGRPGNKARQRQRLRIQEILDHRKEKQEKIIRLQTFLDSHPDQEQIKAEMNLLKAELELDDEELKQAEG